MSGCVTNTNSVHLTVTGGVLTADAQVSADAGNQLVLHSNGLYVAAGPVSPDGGNTLSLHANGLYVPTPAAAPVSSVFGRTGAVAAATNDYSDAQVANSPTQKMTALGDLLYASDPNTLSRLPIAGNGRVLEVSGGLPVWGVQIDHGAASEVGPGADIHHVAFGFTFGNAPHVVITQDTSNGQSSVLATVQSITTTGFDINFPAVGGAGRVYNWIAIGA